MMGRVVVFLLLIFDLSFSFLVAISEGNVATSKVHQRCSVEERDALLGFKQSLSDPQLLSTWEIGEDCCTWQGVSCSNTTNHVIKLDLNEEFPSHSFNQSSIPHSIGSLTELRYLDLSYSGFAGVIPPQLGNLTNLCFLDLSGNYLVAYNLAWMSRLSSLYFIDMSDVNLTSATNWLHEIKVLPSLSSLYLSFCSLHTLPTSLPFSNFSSTINTFDLSFNNLHGSLSNWIGQFKSLKTLYLQSNYLNGPISFSTLNPLCDLYDLNLAENSFIELIDDESVLKCKEYNMTFLDISYNQLSGSIPKWVGKMRNLRKLNLGINKLNGSIPHSLGQLINLVSLDLHSNRLYGSLSDIIFSNLSKLNSLYLSGNDLDFNIIDLSCNNLSGEVPIELMSLVGLRSLNLSRNEFTGHIPINIGDIQSLESLDLSTNHFSGQIPESIVKLSKLNYLNLSYNQLSGRIPSWPQLVTFKESSYYGNSELCGMPLFKTCKDDEHNIHNGGSNPNDDDDDDDFDLFLGMGLGFAVGLWSILGTLLLKKSWAIAYFQWYDDMTNNIYVYVAVKINQLFYH